MPNTYVALRTETVATATSSVTFSLSGISGYTDLVLVSQIKALGGDTNARIRFNGDTTSNYSYTYLSGSGSAAFSNRASSATGGYIDTYGQPQVNFNYSNITHIFNYANTTTFKTVLSRANNAASGVDATVNLWRKTPEAITSITIYSNNANTFDVGSTFNLYGIANADQGAAKATGGIITEDSQYWYHTFGASGAFIPKQSLTCDVLVVAGGGGGGGRIGGGGGGGGFRTGTLSLTTTTYNVTVGGGGARSTGEFNDAANGTDSIFSSITSTGGGKGGTFNATFNGSAGGSGGGSTSSDTTTYSGGAGNTPSTSPSQGNSGGNNTQSANFSAGGGGGASAAGASGAAGSTGAAGGAGASSSYSGLSVTYAGGGGAGINSGTGGAGGAGGGGNGSASGADGLAGTTNTGGGGGGGGTANGGGTGGSGIVIIRYSK